MLIKKLKQINKKINNGSYKDMMGQIIDFCDPNKQGKRKDFWIDKLGTLYPEGLNMKRINQ